MTSEKSWTPNYDDHRIAGEGIARDLAEAEDGAHKKTLGIFGPSQKKLAEAQRLAERKLFADKGISVLGKKEGVSVNVDWLNLESNDWPKPVKAEFAKYYNYYSDRNKNGELAVSYVRRAIDEHTGNEIYQEFCLIEQEQESADKHIVIFNDCCITVESNGQQIIQSSIKLLKQSGSDGRRPFNKLKLKNNLQFYESK